MDKETKKQRTSLRRKITRKINSLTVGLDTLSVAELQGDLDLLIDYETELKKIDDDLLSVLRVSDEVTEDYLNEVEDENDEVARRVKVSKNEILIAIEARKLDSNNGPNRNSNSSRPKIDLPKINLPEFWADSGKDKITCKRFFSVFENMLTNYGLNDTELFNLLERQCMGRAKALISSLNATNQTYAQAKTTLVKAFAEEMPQKFSIVQDFTDLNFRWGKDDPFLYYSQFTKLIEGCQDLSLIHI